MDRGFSNLDPVGEIMRPSCMLCKLFIFVNFAIFMRPPATYAVNVTIENYTLGINVGNGTTNDFGPNITDLTLPLDRQLEFAQFPSSATARYLLDSLTEEQATFLITTELAVGRASPNHTPRVRNGVSFDIRVHEPLLVDISAEMTFDLPPAQMTSSSLIAIGNVDTQESVAGGQLFPPGVSFDGDSDSGIATRDETDVFLEPGFLYRFSYSMNMFAFTDLIGPVGTTTGFGQFTFRSVP